MRLSEDIRVILIHTFIFKTEVELQEVIYAQLYTIND